MPHVLYTAIVLLLTPIPTMVLCVAIGGHDVIAELISFITVWASVFCVLSLIAGFLVLVLWLTNSMKFKKDNK